MGNSEKGGKGKRGTLKRRLEAKLMRIRNVILLPVSLFPFYPFPLVLSREASVCDHAHDVGVGCELAIDFRLTAHSLYA
jgi:hypothetical protein